MAKAARDDAEADLGDTRLRAPFGGLVGKSFVENFRTSGRARRSSA